MVGFLVLFYPPPILNPPQSGILGMHKIEERPVVREGKIEIRPMMYLTLSYDHRIVDGRESVGFLVKVKKSLEGTSSYVDRYLRFCYFLKSLYYKAEHSQI